MIRLVHGDSFNLIKKLNNNSINLVMTDVPYPDMMVHDGVSAIVPSERWIDWFRPMAEEILRILKFTGSFVTTFNSKRDRAVFFRWVNDMTGLGFHYVLTHYWVKKNIIPGSISKMRFPRDGVDFIAHFSKTPQYSADLTRVPDWSAYNHATHVPTNLIYASVRDDKSYWKARKLTGIDHTGKYPSAIPRLFIQMLTAELDCVLDPFNGTGTVTLTAEQLGRQSIGLEKNPQNIRLSKVIYRLEDVSFKHISRKSLRLSPLAT